VIALPLAGAVAMLLYAPYWEWQERRLFARPKADLSTNARPVLV